MQESMAQSIMQAFAQSAWAADAPVTESVGEEAEAMGRAFADRPHWHTLSAAFLNAAPEGYGSALSFFSPAAFRFYLPAYLLADGRGELLQLEAVFHLTHGLEPYSRDHPIGGQEKHRTWLDHARARFDPLSPQQARAILAYLQWKMAAGSPDDHETAAIREAIAFYWQIRAEGGAL